MPLSHILTEYKSNIAEIERSNLREIQNLTQGIQCSQKCLQQLRLEVRNSDFSDRKKEIIFFKKQKPFVHGRLKYFLKLHEYFIRRPACIEERRSFINRCSKKLEEKKNKHLDFYQYYRHNNTLLDAIYFVRGNDKLELVSDTSHYFTDPEFSTSHDNLMAQIIAYDLLTNFYKQELAELKKRELNVAIDPCKEEKLPTLKWSASKTDLVELIYALQAGEAINNGHSTIKEISTAFEKLFDINLGSYYKTYAEIRARKLEPTIFLDMLTHCLQQKMKEDELNY